MISLLIRLAKLDSLVQAQHTLNEIETSRHAMSTARQQSDRRNIRCLRTELILETNIFDQIIEISFEYFFVVALFCEYKINDRELIYFNVFDIDICS